MLRRSINLQLVVAPWLWPFGQAAHAGTFSAGDAAGALRLTLERGAHAAVDLLARVDGFLGNPKVRIPLPAHLSDVATWMARFGQQRRVDELVTAMNRAAEAAVPKARTLLISAVKGVNLQDAQQIITGDDNSVTAFFAEKTRVPLGEEFLPIVTQATERVSLAAKYNKVASKAASLGMLDARDANIQQYVTGKALDGLYLMIGDEERRIRQDPAATGVALLKQVFGAIKTQK